MRRLLFNIIVFLISASASGQNSYLISKDSASGQTIFKGIISEDILLKEESFSWMKVNLSNYQPDSIAIKLITQNKDSLHVLIFLGTWCEDSQQIIPKLFKLLHKANLPNDHISILGVDRQKKTLGHFSEGLNVSRVPTIIILKQGEEIGRVVEYGKYGIIDKDLAEIIKP